MASRTRSSNGRASLAVVAGLVSVATVPGAIVLAQRSASLDLVDAAWAIPVAFAAGVAALLLARGAHGAWARSLERSGGPRRIRLARVLAVVGLSLTLAAAIAVGFYELLVRLEH